LLYVEVNMMPSTQTSKSFIWLAILSLNCIDDRDAAWNAFNEDQRDGFVPVMKVTQSFQAAVDFIVNE
jgi:hypothetical protein